MIEKIKRRELITISQAIQLMVDMGAPPISRPTVIKWAKKYTLGKQFNEERGSWYIDKQKWKEFVTHGIL